MTRYIGASCLVNYCDEPRPDPFHVFIKFGSYDDETATGAERVADQHVFYYVDDLAEFRELVSSGSVDFVITDVIELVKGE